MLKSRGGAYWYTGGYNIAARVAYLVGTGLAVYRTQISPLSFGATIPTFVPTFVLYLLVHTLLGRLAQRSPAPTSGFRK